MDKWQRRLNRLDQINPWALVIITLFASLLSATIILLSVQLIGSLERASHERQQDLLDSRQVSIDLGDNSLSVSRLTVKAGVIRFKLANLSQLNHRLLLLDSRGRQLAVSPPLTPGGRRDIQWAVYRGRYQLVISSDQGSSAQLKVVD